MKAQKILAQVRLYVGDAAKAKFADWQAVRAINDALRVMAEENAKSAGLLFRRNADVVLEEESGVLPSDYLNVIRGFGAEGRELLQVHGDSPGAGEYAIRGDVRAAGNFVVFLDAAGGDGRGIGDRGSGTLRYGHRARGGRTACRRRGRGGLGSELFPAEYASSRAAA